jgi:hypothetical protein
MYYLTMEFPRVQHYAWMASLGVGLGNIGILLGRRLVGQWPLLFGYLVVSSGCGTLLFLATPYLSPHDYGLAFWIHQLALLLMAVLLVQSFWRICLTRYRGLQRLCLALLVSTVMAGLVVVVFTSRSTPSIQLTPANWLNQWLFLFYRSALFVVAGLLWLFFGFLSVFQIEVGRTSRNLAMGLFTFALVRVVVDSWRFLKGPSPLDGLGPFWGLMVQSLWCIALVRHRADEPVQTAPVLALHLSQDELQRRVDAINGALLRLLD